MAGGFQMSNKMKNTKNNKKQDGKFDKKKHIPHDPQAESAIAVFERPKVEDLH
jgi:hypothetical protein